MEAVVVMAVAAGVLSSLRTPIYSATAKVLLTPNDPNQQLNPTTGNGVVGNDPDRYVAGQITIAQSADVASEAVKSLQGVSLAAVEAKTSVSQGGQSNVLDVSASDPDPAQARDIADAVAKGYIENRRKAAVSGLQGAADDIESKLGPLQTQIAQLDSQIGDGSTIAGATSTLVSPINPSSTLAPSQPAAQLPPATGTTGGAPSTQEALKAARYAAAVQYETLYARQQELVVDISLKRGDAELIAEANTPTTPVSPRPKRDAALGAFLGLVLGIGTSLLREQLNDTVRSAEEIEAITGLPLLAQVPFDEHAAEPGLVVRNHPSGPVSEAVRALRTSIQYLGVDEPARVILVSSSLPGEGKSFVAANLAGAFAQADYRTVLVSADLRRPTVNGVFADLGSSIGLVGAIAPETRARRNGQTNRGEPLGFGITQAQTLLRTPVDRLLLLPSGCTPPNPAELLGSRRMASLLEQLSANADIIVLDSPPLLPVTDAAVLAAKCDGVVLVTASNETHRAALERSKAILDATGARVLGVVVNKARRTPNSYYRGYYAEAELPVRSTKRHRLQRRHADRPEPARAALKTGGHNDQIRTGQR